MDVMKLAVPAITISPMRTVAEAVAEMAEHKVSSIVVTSAQNVLLGIFSEHDNLVRITNACKDPAGMMMSEVMTSPVISVRPEMHADEALNIMIRNHIRHLPVTDPTLHVVGMLSMRALLMRRISEQKEQLETLGAYVSAGGPG